MTETKPYIIAITLYIHVMNVTAKILPKYFILQTFKVLCLIET